MNPGKHIFRTMLFAMTSWFGESSSAVEPPPAGQILYPTGTQQSFKGPENVFTGEVRVDMLFPGNDTAHYSGAYVTFKPGARTAWHLHPAGQHMIVTNGTALTGTRDGKVIEFHEGEAVWCPSGIDHWHGATPDAPMTHLVITGSKDGENVVWKEKVSDEEYLTAVKHTAKEITMTGIHVVIGNKTYTATLDDTPAGRDFAALLPLELTLADYNATEKVANLPRRLVTTGAPDSYTPKAGDITYYSPWGNLAIFYKPFQTSTGLVRLGAFNEPIDALVKDGAIPIRIEASQ